ncbi:hypothetical protein EHQ83_07850 [Leptospira yasudae]|uniref:Uncharacterized protein n=1 Tax=Leptospira yasudae TaxID=2202201 RepID=A0A6N4QEL7_9LEPT|nr:hypothetical protein EHQ72_14080 [Leptospira yasudae]TGL83492.1 hypothetical protein EHQ77_01515 [Leptospira yasudae]TGL85396.1 hypothetical protein EHQ83_07850 [Leptospira yasudae]
MSLCILFLFAKSVSLSNAFSNQKIADFRLSRFDFDQSENSSLMKKNGRRRIGTNFYRPCKTQRNWIVYS